MAWETKFDIKDVSYACLTFNLCIDYKGTVNTIHNNTIQLLYYLSRRCYVVKAIALLTDLIEETIKIVTHNCRKNGAKRKEIV